jgi:hypothetical protein
VRSGSSTVSLKDEAQPTYREPIHKSVAAGLLRVGPNFRIARRSGSGNAVRAILNAWRVVENLCVCVCVSYT